MPAPRQFDPDIALDRAMHRFWAGGYATTSLADLLDATGLNRSSLYATYGSKHALFLASLERYDDRCRGARLRELAAQRSPRAAIRGLFEGWVEGALDGTGRDGCLLANSAAEPIAADPAVGRLIARSQRDTEAFLRHSIERARALGEVSPAVDAAAAAKLLLAALLGLLVLVRTRPEPVLLHGIVEEALAFLD